MAAVGLPLALLLGVGADLVAGLLRSGSPLRSVTTFRAELTAALSKGGRASLLEAAGGGGALLGSGLLAAAAIGAVPGDAALLILALGLAVVGAHLAAVDLPTRPAVNRARLRLLEAVPVTAAAAGAVVAGFLRWRATDLGSIWGAGEVLGVPLAVGPPMAAAGQVMALVAVAAAAGLLVPLETEPPRGRYRRPAAAALLARLARWGLTGAAASLVAAFSVGVDLTSGGEAASYLLWAAGALAGTIVVGAAWGGLDRLGPKLRLPVAVPLVLALSGAGAVMVSVA